jgi:hypothetical protein
MRHYRATHASPLQKRSLFSPGWRVGFALLLLLAGCASTRAGQEYRTGTVLLDEQFEQNFAWESYSSTDSGIDLGVEAGEYRMRADGEGFIWGLNSVAHDNVVIEVQTAQRSELNDNAYGVMCRAAPENNGDGYYFLISGDGFWSIRVMQNGEGRALVDFSRSAAINQGQSINTVRAVCIGNYLALYINEEFAGEARDDTFSRGFAGLTVAAKAGEQIDIGFDNLRIIEASLAE